MVLRVLVIVLFVWMILSLPLWPYARSWGYGPSGLGLLLFVVLLLVLLREL